MTEAKATTETSLLGQKDAVVTLAVKNLGVAKEFYEGKLGLKRTSGDEGEEALTYQSGSTKIFVYESQYAGTNRATAATWLLGDDLDKVVRELKAKGVKFERYDLPDMSHEGDVHVAGDMRAAWLKDPDGNILGLINR